MINFEICGFAGAILKQILVQIDGKLDEVEA